MKKSLVWPKNFLSPKSEHMTLEGSRGLLMKVLVIAELLGVSKGELSEVLYIPQSTLSAWIKGRYKIPKAHVALMYLWLKETTQTKVWKEARALVDDVSVLVETKVPKGDVLEQTKAGKGKIWKVKKSADAKPLK